MIKNYKCRLGFHVYTVLGTQTNMKICTMREVKKCERCNKVKYQCFDISLSYSYLNTLKWTPNISELENSRPKPSYD